MKGTHYHWFETQPIFHFWCPVSSILQGVFASSSSFPKSLLFSTSSPLNSSAFITLSLAVLHQSACPVPQWCGRVVKTQCFESCEFYSRGFESLSSEPLTTSQQSTQLSILPRLVNEYSEVTLRAQAVMPQAHISFIAATYPACANK